MYVVASGLTVQLSARPGTMSVPPGSRFTRVSNIWLICADGLAVRDESPIEDDGVRRACEDEGVAGLAVTAAAGRSFVVAAATTECQSECGYDGHEPAQRSSHHRPPCFSWAPPNRRRLEYRDDDSETFGSTRGLLQLRVERLAQAVADQVEAEHGDDDRGAGDEREERRGLEVVVRVGEHASPTRA